VVADAAFALNLPLVAAIGHEVDTSVIELVADRRASTPTQAVMLLLPDTTALRERHERMMRELRNTMRWSLQARRERIAALERTTALASPTLRIAEARRSTDQLGGKLRARIGEQLRCERVRLDRLSVQLAQHSPAARAALARASIAAMRPRLARAVAQLFAREHAALVNLERRLRSSGPQETLARGYAILTTSSGELVRSIRTVTPGTSIVAQVADGRLETRVASVVEQGTERSDDLARSAQKGVSKK
ncbi:MAG: exodeoxyribonuclease VII large subunit, partial [Limnohabitans sp.]|nr:exodeoxyribonuclease VII large subunit [Limnohabitans sp.]